MTSLRSGVSVVVPAFNAGRYLGEALDSLLAQTVPPVEVIVLDDGSTDNTAQVAEAYAPRVSYLHQANAGSGAARNRGLAAAHGECLAFLDSDDRWEPDKLERQLSALAAAPGLEAVFCHVRQFLSPDRANDPALQRLIVPEQSMPAFYASTLLIRRTAFDRVGPFATNLLVGEFIDWYARATQAGLAISVLPDVLVWRRIHGGNSTLRHKHQRTEYARVLKAALDRKRAAQAGTGEP